MSFNYNPSGHYRRPEHRQPWTIISHGPKFRELQYISWNHNCIMMHSVELYTRTWAMREFVELGTFSEWGKPIRFLILRRFYKLKLCVNARPKSVFKDKKANKWLPLFTTICCPICRHSFL